MKKLSVLIIALMILSSFVLPVLGLESSESLIEVLVVNEVGESISGATVTLWNHSATPTEQAGVAVSNDSGSVWFSYPEFKGEDSQMTQHLSVTVSYLHYRTEVLDWSINRRAIAGDELKTIEPTILPRSTIKATLNIEKEMMSQISPDSEVAIILERIDYTSGINTPTVVGHQHQVGNLESTFGYKDYVSNRFSAAIKYKDDDSFTTSAYYNVQTQISTDITWTLAAKGDTAGYAYRECITQFDYRIEEYVEKTYMDRGDGKLEWIETDRWIKVFCHKLNDYASPDGYPGTKAPPADTDWLTGNPIQPGGKVLHMKRGSESIGVAAEIPILWVGLVAKLSVDHSTSNHVGWGYHNMSLSKTYHQGISDGQVYYRLKP